MTNQYTGIIKKPDYATLYQLEKRKGEDRERDIQELIQALLRKYEELPDDATKRLLIVHLGGKFFNSTGK